MDKDFHKVHNQDNFLIVLPSECLCCHCEGTLLFDFPESFLSQMCNACNGFMCINFLCQHNPYTQSDVERASAFFVFVNWIGVNESLVMPFTP